MSDTIYRDDAIKAAQRLLISDEHNSRHLNDLEYGNNQALYYVIDEIEELPSADRPSGEWIVDARRYYETLNGRGFFVDENTRYFVDSIACSECLTMFSNIDNETERFNFCPHCGAEMV